MTSFEHSHSSSSNEAGTSNIPSREVNEFSGCVFVIDDNPEVRQMLALALETAGFDVLEVGTEIELQRHLAHIRPDALVIDFRRSETDGLKLLARMRARAALRDVPIILLANSDADDFQQLALRAGADWFGLRPLGMVELQNRVGELVSRRRATAQRARHRRRQVIPLTRTG
jgi:two-component system, OmpR family, phosphate regulon response regulator PhoB